MRLTVLGAVVAATAVALLAAGGAEGVKWSKCQVAAQLLRNGFQRKDLPTSLLDDNIADDSKCARLIAAKQGLDAWVAYKQKCKGKNLSQYNVKPC
ncbi:Lysozyme c-1 [Gryllus bimaculatus]|nr:Lysozyme c-1 [Gryllus bimaculatus]